MTNVTRLPGPIADIWDWQRLGLCRGRDSAQFFHPDGERGASRGRREAAAKSVCRSCPVRAECAAHALSTREPYGVWGGFTEAERIQLLAIGWEECASRGRTRVDVPRLERRLGVTPGITTPGITTPGITTPGITTPGITTPGINAPGINAPGIPPGVTAPSVNAPAADGARGHGTGQRIPRPRLAAEAQRMARTKLRLRAEITAREHRTGAPARLRVAPGNVH